MNGLDSYFLTSIIRFQVFLVRKNNKLNENIGLMPLTTPLTNSFNIKNENLGLKFDVQGNLIAIDNFASGISTPLQQNLCVYKADNSYSGAYVFRYGFLS